MDSLRSIWNQMPAVRLLIPFIIGIGLYIEIPGQGSYPVIVVGMMLVSALAVILYVNQLVSATTVYQWRYASGVAMFVVMLALGYVVTFFNTEPNDHHDIANIDKAFIQTKATWIGVIAEPIVVRPRTVSVVIALQKAGKDDSSVHISGKVLASIIKDDKSEQLRYGDRVVFTGQVAPYEEPRNPGQFDYRSYQALHHIYHQTYLTAGDWQLVARDQGNALLSGIYTVRAHFLTMIQKCIPGTDELAVAAAIMLGFVDYETDDVKQAYAGSGVMHVLSVSGLHVAVLYFVLNILLGWMDRRRKWQIAKGVLLIVIMMCYAVLTGLSPPTLRSVWMFSLIIIAKLLDRDVRTFNVLGVSCLVLLIWDPYYIADVGFQLSYIAVAGIVYLYPLFHGLLPLPSISFKKPFGFISTVLNYLLDFTWGLICVSIAAQIATFPISLYYFHNFPNFFLLSNLLVIPLSNFVLISGMVFFAAGWSHTLMMYAGWVFDHLLIVLNRTVFWIDGLPFALSRDMMVSVFEMAMLYIVIVMVCWFIADRRPRVLLSALVCILIVCTSFSIDSIWRDDHSELIVNSIPGKKAISLIIHRRAYYDIDTAITHHETLMRNNIRGHWSQCGVSEEIPADSAGIAYHLACGAVYTVNGKRIMVINKGSLAIPKTKADVAILSGNCNNTIQAIRDKIDFKELVFDTSIKAWQVRKWIAECEQMNIRYHDCRDRAFEMDL